MKLIIATTILVLTTACLLNFIMKSVDNFHIAKALVPFGDGKPLNLQYSFASVIALGIILWGILRLANRKDDK